MTKIKILTLFLISIILFSGCSKQIEPKTKEYYYDFRNKCQNKYDKSCCLDSVDNAEKENSLLFESDNGNMDIDTKCPDDSRPDMNRCETSYVWCSKK